MKTQADADTRWHLSPTSPKVYVFEQANPFQQPGGAVQWYEPTLLQASVGQCSIPQVVFVFLFYIFLHPISPFVEYAFKCDPALFECKQASSCIYGRSCGEIRLPSSSKEQTAPVFSRLVEASFIVALAGCCVLQ